MSSAEAPQATAADEPVDWRHQPASIVELPPSPPVPVSRWRATWAAVRGAALWVRRSLDGQDVLAFGGLACTAGAVGRLWRPAGGLLVIGLGLLYLGWWHGLVTVRAFGHGNRERD